MRRTRRGMFKLLHACSNRFGQRLHALAGRLGRSAIASPAFVKAADRGDRLAFILQRQAEVKMRAAPSGPGRYRALETRQGLVRPSLQLVDNCKAGVCFGTAGIKRNGSEKTLLGLRELIARAMCLAEVVVGRRDAGVLMQGPADQRDGVEVASELVRDDAGQMQCVELGSVVRQNLAVHGFGLV